MLKFLEMTHACIFEVPTWNDYTMCRVIKKTYPPSRAEMKNSPGKLSIAFSNTTYLDIIWKFREESPKLRHVFLAAAKRQKFFAQIHSQLGLKIA